MDDGRTVIGRVLSPSFIEFGAGIYPEDTMESEVCIRILHLTKSLVLL
jgi:hypothetical protein